MENALLSDISPNVRALLERRGKNLADRSKNASASEQEAVKAIYIRAVPLLTDFDKDTWAESPQDAQAVRNMLMLKGGNLGENSTVGPPSLEYNPTKRQGKPTAGLTGLTVEQRGLGEGLISVITLKGVIPSIDNLETYLPFLFTPGNYWLLEWGFTKTKGNTKLINLTQFFAQTDVQKLYDIVNTHRKSTGENDAVIGCTKTYEYSVNEAGGFEFSIEMLSNSTLFKKNIQATTNYTIGYYEKPEEIKKTKKGVSLDSIEASKEAVKNQISKAAGLDTEKIIENQLKFNTATPKDFFSKLKEYMIRYCLAVGSNGKKGLGSKSEFKEGNLFRLGKRNIKKVEIDTGFDSIKKRGIFYKNDYPWNTRTNYVIIDPISKEKTKKKVDRHNGVIDDVGLGPYCTWGWMEDNILSIAYGMVGSEIGETFKIESTDHEGLPNILNSHESLYTTDPSKFIIPGRTAEIFEKTIQEEKAYTRTGRGDTGQIKNKLDVLDTYQPIVKEYTKLSEAALPFDSNNLSDEQQFLSREVRNLMSDDAKKVHRELIEQGGAIGQADMYDQREIDVPVSKDLKGSVRRLVLHWKVIQEAFINAPTVDIGLKKLYSIIEREYTGFWKFDQMSTDTKLSTIELNSIQEIDPPAVKTEHKTNTPIYTFPSFGRVSVGDAIHDPLVISQQLTVTVPDSAGLAMMFANNKSGQEALANSNFGNNIDNQLITVLTQQETANSKILVKPTFQRGKIKICSSISRSGVYARTREIKPGEIFSTYKLPKSKFTIADEQIQSFIANGWKSTSGVVSDIGERLSKIQFGEDWQVKRANTDPTKLSYKFGMAIDAEGKMYPGYHSRMLFYLNNQIMVDEKLVTGKTTRLLEPVKLTFKVLGVAGLNWGNKFNISYIPEKFRKQTCFMISGITHNISENKWTTDITGTMRYLPSKQILVNKLSVDPNLLAPINDSMSKADDDFFNQLKTEWGDETNVLLGGAMSRYMLMTKREAETEERKAQSG